MKELADSLSSEEIGSSAYHLYEQFRPSVVQGQQGWGKKGRLEFAQILELKTWGFAVSSVKFVSFSVCERQIVQNNYYASFYTAIQVIFALQNQLFVYRRQTSSTANFHMPMLSIP